jgi:hypothetical protein
VPVTRRFYLGDVAIRDHVDGSRSWIIIVSCEKYDYYNCNVKYAHEEKSEEVKWHADDLKPWFETRPHIGDGYNCMTCSSSGGCKAQVYGASGAKAEDLVRRKDSVEERPEEV